MKKTVLLFVSILIQTNIFGQEYIPFNFKNGIWICYEGFFGDGSQTYNI